MIRFALGLAAAVAATSVDVVAQGTATDTARGSGVAIVAVNDTVGARLSPPNGTPVAIQPLAGASRTEPVLSRWPATSAAPARVPQTARERRGMKYMLIGGALLLTGAIVDDDAGDILMIGGVVVGFYGLWIFIN
jgi:hypothetical protein